MKQRSFSPVRSDVCFPNTATPLRLRHPEGSELADLVCELYTEGTLSYQELHAFSRMPELNAHLHDTLGAIDPTRRILA